MPLVTCQVCGQIVSATSDCPLCGTNWERWRVEQEELDRQTEADAISPIQYVGFGKRVLATLIDLGIALVFLPFLVPIMEWGFEHRTILPTVLSSLSWTLLYLGLVIRFGGTPGKLVVGARIVDAQGRYVMWGRAILRIIPSLLISLNDILRFSVVMQRCPDSETGLSWIDIGRLLNETGQPFTGIGIAFGFFIYFDIGVIFFNRRKRAIHDFIAGSFVITKKSYQTIAQANASGEEAINLLSPPDGDQDSAHPVESTTPTS